MLLYPEEKRHNITQRIRPAPLPILCIRKNNRGKARRAKGGLYTIKIATSLLL